jgi:1-acyl-sn-glycerol-3-phosphate acyltransferase
MIFRSLVFNLTFLGASTVYCTLALPSLLGPRTWACRARDIWAALVLALLKYVAGVDHLVEGLENVPNGKILVAANHQSVWETLAIHTIFPDPVIVVKRELLMIPVFGWFISKLGMIPIDRKAGASAVKEIIREARKKSNTDRPTVIFPQGTRSAPGLETPYHHGVYALYRELGVPLCPVALNSGFHWSHETFVKRPGTIQVRILPAIPPGLGRSAFMDRLETAIQDASRDLALTSKLVSGPLAIT